MIKAISDLKLPTDLIDIIEDYYIDLRDNSINYDCSTYDNNIYMCPHPLVSNNVNALGRPKMGYMVDMDINDNWGEKTRVGFNKREVVTKSFIYQFIEGVSPVTAIPSVLHYLAKYIKRNYKGKTYAVKIFGENFVVPVSLYLDIRVWMIQDYDFHSAYNTRDDLGVYLN